MTGTAPSADQIASRVRRVAARARQLTVDLQHRSWSGGPTYDVEIANLARAVGRLEDAATALAGQGFPRKSAIIAAAVGSGLWIAVTAAVLGTVPDPGRPGVIVSAAVAGWVASDTFYRANLATRWRRITVAPAAPQDQTPPTAERIRQIQANVDELLHLMAAGPDDRSIKRHEAAAEDVRAARIWLAEAENAG